MIFTIYTSDGLNNRQNCYYKNKIEVTNEESLKLACSCDYTCAEYKNSYRSAENFLSSNCIPFDCDNDHSEKPEDWITPKDISDAFPGIAFAVHYSRSNNISKNGKAPRPKFHVLFPIKEMTDAKAYAELKKQVSEYFPYFDNNALDSARFFFGTKDILVEIHEGSELLDDFMQEDFDANMPRHNRVQVITEGARNGYLSRFAARVLKKYGNSDESKHAFLEESAKCQPPLEKAELRTIWQSAIKFYDRLKADPSYVAPDVYNKDESSTNNPSWDEPLPLVEDDLPVFPIECLPNALKDYALAIAESTQTPVDMAAIGTLTCVSACMRNLYKVEGKPDWHEPTNLYTLIVAEPSERKSAVVSLVSKPIDEYVLDYNSTHKVDFEISAAKKQSLESKKNRLINGAKKKGESDASQDFNDEIQEVIQQLVDFKEEKPLKVYVDDITPEKLVETLAENNNAIAMLSSEGGIFDVLSGTYSNKVNFDVFLKAYSGENISVERIMRNSTSVYGACLTILLSVQPITINNLMSNESFKRRGLTARFIYVMPKSKVGSRDFESEPIPDKTYDTYKKVIFNILTEQRGSKETTIELTAGARKQLNIYYDWVESKFTDEYSAYADWMGKLVGNTLRIAGVIARSSIIKNDVGDAILETDKPIVIDEKIMVNAITIGKYLFCHAMAAYSSMGVYTDNKAVLKLLSKIKQKKFTEVTRRIIMRECHFIKTVDDAQRLLDILEDYGYIRISYVSVTEKAAGRPKNIVYSVNPSVHK